MGLSANSTTTMEGRRRKVFDIRLQVLSNSEILLIGRFGDKSKRITSYWNSVVLIWITPVWGFLTAALLVFQTRGVFVVWSCLVHRRINSVQW